MIVGGVLLYSDALHLYPVFFQLLFFKVDIDRYRSLCADLFLNRPGALCTDGVFSISSGSAGEGVRLIHIHCFTRSVYSISSLQGYQNVINFGLVERLGVSIVPDAIVSVTDKLGSAVGIHLLEIFQ